MNLDLPVSEMMTRNMVSVKPDQKLSDVKELFRDGHFHYNIPVIENNVLKGMVVLTDFMFAIMQEPATRKEADYTALSIRDVMHEKVKVISPSTTVREAARLFSTNEHHTLMVAENQSLKGIVSVADIIRYLLYGQERK